MFKLREAAILVVNTCSEKLFFNILKLPPQAFFEDSGTTPKLASTTRSNGEH